MSMGNRVCVSACPKLVNGAVQTLNCLPEGITCTYSVVINQNGTAN